MNEERAETHEIGVLFVHGIGQQKRGETLVDYADPIADWTRGWLSWPSSGNPYSRYKAGACILHSAVLDRPKSEPPHLTFHLEATPNAGNGSERVRTDWLLAECHWANSFPPPTVAEVTSYSIPAVPWAVASHFARRINVAPRRSRSRLLRWIQLLLFALPLVVVTEIMLFAVTSLGRLPIPGFETVLRRIDEVIALVIGDSYVFIASPVRLSSILRKFDHDLAWLTQRCDKVVIVGHSQGAAVALHGLFANPQPKLKLLVTLGAGIYKLRELQYYREERYIPVDIAIHVLLWLLVLGATWRLSTETLSLADAAGLVGTYLLANGLFAVFAFLWGRQSLKSAWRPYEAFGLPKPWIDFYASADPVPNGPLPETFSAESKPVYNRGSVLLDHTSYTSNLDEFVTALVTAIARHAESRIPLHNLTRRDAASIEAGKRARAWMVKYLVLFRWYLILAATATATFNHSLILNLGAWLARWHFLATRLSTYGLGVLGTFAVAAAIYRVACALWNAAVNFRAQMLFQRSEGGTDPPFSIYLGLVTGLFFAVFCIATWPMVISIRLLSGINSVLVAILFALLLILTERSFDRQTKI